MIYINYTSCDVFVDRMQRLLTIKMNICDVFHELSMMRFTLLNSVINPLPGNCYGRFLSLYIKPCQHG